MHYHYRSGVQRFSFPKTRNFFESTQTSLANNLSSLKSFLVSNSKDRTRMFASAVGLLILAAGLYALPRVYQDSSVGSKVLQATTTTTEQSKQNNCLCKQVLDPVTGVIRQVPL